MRCVGQFLRYPQNFLSCHFAYSGASVQSAVNCPNRDLGQLRDLVNAGPFHFYFATTSSLPSTRFTELPPTIILNVPGSTTRCISRFRNDSSSGPNVNSTLFVSPGFSVTRWNPRSSFTGRVTELTSSRI